MFVKCQVLRSARNLAALCCGGMWHPTTCPFSKNDRYSDMIATLANKKKNRLPGILEHASGDKRFKILEAHMKKHQFKHDALIEVLHKAQELFGFLEDDLLVFISYKLKLPASRVYGVATFYHFFTLKPKGRHTCVVCMGTACYVKGADKILAAVEQKSRIKAGETTRDGQLSLLTARCIGACGIAPAVVYDGTVTPRQGPNSALEHLQPWLDGGQPQPQTAPASPTTAEPLKG
jgi:bidirectional [NiFe] hydrogenase diaphorase subunit